MGIALNPTWQLTVRTLLTLYIIIYGLSYLAGKIQVKTYDVFTRIAKLAVVFAMFSPSSWKFFNENVFVIFLDGMSYLTYSVIGLTSDVSNIFGFVDIIFDKYTNLEVWEAILISLLQIHNGMTYIAILLIEAILSYLVAVIDVVVSYIMAFLTICVLISLAPLFIVCMLFERTRSMFDSWVSLLFNYMIQPTVLLIFFLLIDQLMAQQFAYVLIKSCWGWLIELNIDLDLREIIPGFRVKFDLPFLPGIPFFIPALSGAVSPFVNFGGEITRIAGAVLMFKIYAQLASGLVEYSINLVATLTGSRPGRKAGREQSASNPVQAITQELKAPFVAVKDRAKGFGKGLYKASKEGYRNPEESDSKKNDSKKSEALKKRDESSAPSPKMGTAKDIDE
ncbi:MAG UNVERIFIED_CONTAM: type IV secretion system protein [Planctomycetaceae bacterium]